MSVNGRPGQPSADPPVGHGITGEATEHGGVGQAVAPEAVGAVDAARVLARREEALDARATGGIDHHAAHHEVRGGPDLDRLAREIATEVAAAPDHAAENGLHGLRAEVRDVDPDSAVGAAPSLLDLGEARAPDEIAG